MSAADGSLPLLGGYAGCYSFAGDLSGPFRPVLEPMNFSHRIRWQCHQFMLHGPSLGIFGLGRMCRWLSWAQDFLHLGPQVQLRVQLTVLFLMPLR